MNNIVLRAGDVCRGNLILVNPDFPMIKKEPSDLTAINNTKIKICREAASQLDLAMKKINGWTGITPVSGYRSFEEQQNIWNDCLKENGIDFTRKYVARSAYSEHLTGLAIDLGMTQLHIDFVRPEFPDYGICGQFKKITAEFGFILRYPLGKEHVTKIAYEPWHFRYVGIPHAQIIRENGFVLEEYIEYIRRFKHNVNPFVYRNKYEISYLTRSDYSFEDTNIVNVSGNNCDGFIITRIIERG